MFAQFIGKYLISNNLISKEQFVEILEEQNSSRVKLGLIAVSEKMLTQAQADKINMLQSTMDKRFGDIAVEQGLLTDEQVGTLLKLQGNAYLKFIQTLVDKGIMTLEQIEKFLSDYKNANDLSFEDIESLKSDDIDRIINVFIKTGNKHYDEYIGLMIRNIVRFIDSSISFGSPVSTTTYKAHKLGSQCIKGDLNIFAGFSGNDNNLLTIANAYAKEEFPAVDEDAYDSVCEFINCVNGLFASKLSNEDVDVDMLPPVSYDDVTLKSDNNFYVVPIKINMVDVDLVIGINSAIVAE